MKFNKVLITLLLISTAAVAQALEHAGTADDGGATLKRVEKLIDGTTTWRLNGVKVRRR
jgi:hypothetical protein